MCKVSLKVNDLFLERIKKGIYDKKNIVILCSAMGLIGNHRHRATQEKNL